MAHESDGLLPTRWTLISRLKNWDDHESWREFFDRYWKLVYGTALKSGLTPTEAQDVVQETIVSVCKNIGKFRAKPDGGSFKSWLLNLARWRIIDQVRKHRPEQVARAHKPGRNPDDSATTSTVAGIADPAANDLERIWDNEWERNLLTTALEKLERQVTAIKPDQVY